MNNKVKPKLLAICLIIPLCVGALSAFLSRDGMANFDTIAKPALTPPPIVFIVVWTLLYLSMGVASYLVLSSRESQMKIDSALRTYVVGLTFNFFWSIFFFGLSVYLFSFFWLVGLWIAVLANIVAFYRISRPAGLILVPYLLWVTFAGYLNFSVFLMNV